MKEWKPSFATPTISESRIFEERMRKSNSFSFAVRFLLQYEKRNFLRIDEE